MWRTSKIDLSRGARNGHGDIEVVTLADFERVISRLIQRNFFHQSLSIAISSIYHNLRMEDLHSLILFFPLYHLKFHQYLIVILKFDELFLTVLVGNHQTHQFSILPWDHEASRSFGEAADVYLRLFRLYILMDQSEANRTRFRQTDLWYYYLVVQVGLSFWNELLPGKRATVFQFKFVRINAKMSKIGCLSIPKGFTLFQRFLQEGISIGNDFLFLLRGKCHFARKPFDIT